jgi:UDP-N-acetyl-D-mannosaminuronic acid dehydrogenase
MIKHDSIISVIGLGYIGLPTAAMFSTHGARVIGVDVNSGIVDTINRGEIHIVEPGLETAVKHAVDQGVLRATLVPEPADAFLIAVPTPFKGDQHEPDLRFVQSACAAIAPVLRAGNLVVLESTSPVGATDQLSAWLAEARPDLTFPQTHGELSDIRIAHCPERVLPGKVMEELISNDRVIGGVTPRCSQQAINLYSIFVKAEFHQTNARTAELAKLTENSFRDVNIAFANELSLICDRLGIDVWELIKLANRHPRVNILQPGPGVGGHCIAVDPWFIVSSAPEEARLIRTAREVNDRKPEWVIDTVKKAVSAERNRNVDGNKNVTIACLGLAFKADIDDLRESPAVQICDALVGIADCTVLIAEPNIEQLPLLLADRVKLVDTAEAVAQAQVVVLLVDHKQFKLLSSEFMRGKSIVDTRGVFAKFASSNVI